MRAHTPPFTKPEAAYDSRRLYEETSAIAAAQDARHAMTDAERESKLRTVAHYIYHAKLLMDEVFGTERASHAAPPATPDFTIAQDPPDLPMGWLASGGIPAESSYLASLGMGDAERRLADAHRPIVGDMKADEYGVYRWVYNGLGWSPIEYGANDLEYPNPSDLGLPPFEQLREHGIGDVEPRHPMHAEALRDHDERLFGGEDRL